MLPDNSMQTVAPAADAVRSSSLASTRADHATLVNRVRVSPDQKGRSLIVIAEDHTDSRDALSALLEAVGYEVHPAANGKEAIELALALQPDLVLMDIMMPELDGLEATRRLRRNESFRQVPILALTAMEGARERALEAGCDDYVIKPIDVPSLFNKVQSWLDRSR